MKNTESPPHALAPAVPPCVNSTTKIELSLPLSFLSTFVFLVQARLHTVVGIPFPHRVTPEVVVGDVSH